MSGNFRNVDSVILLLVVKLMCFRENAHEIFRSSEDARFHKCNFSNHFEILMNNCSHFYTCLYHIRINFLVLFENILFVDLVFNSGLKSKDALNEFFSGAS